VPDASALSGASSHIHSRGAGRVDIRGNLIALGGAFDCNCHGLTHDGKIGREELLLLTALREGLTVESIVDESASPETVGQRRERTKMTIIQTLRLLAVLSVLKLPS